MSRFVMYLSILKAIKTWRIYIIQKLTLIIFDCKRHMQYNKVMYVPKKCGFKCEACLHCGVDISFCCILLCIKSIVKNIRCYLFHNKLRHEVWNVNCFRQSLKYLLISIVKNIMVVTTIHNVITTCWRIKCPSLTILLTVSDFWTN